MKKNLLYLAVILLCVNLFVLFLFVYNRQTDTQPPVIHFAQGQLEVSVGDPQSALLQGVTAQDQVDGDISHRVRITSLDEQSVTALGVHLVQLRVSNSLGETVELEIPVEVYPAGTYGATLHLTDYLVYVPAGRQLSAESYLDSFVANGQTISLAGGLPEGFSLEMKSDVKPEVPGVYTVEYRVTRQDETNSVTGYAKLIVVVEG